MKKSLFISLIIFASFLFFGCPEAAENYPFWYVDNLEDIQITLDADYDSEEYCYSVRKNQTLTCNFSGQVDSSDFKDLAVFIGFYKTIENNVSLPYSNYEIEEPEELKLSHEGNICTCIFPVDEGLTTIDKNIKFKFTESGKYYVRIYIDAPCKDFLEADFATFDMCHGVFEEVFSVKVKEE